MSTVSGGPGPAGADHVLPFQLDALGVRGRLVRLGPALDSIIERHGYPLAVARPLAEAMVLCATLATSLKYDGIFTLQITGDGPIRLLVTDLTTDGALRGYAQFDSWKLAVALGAGRHEAQPTVPAAGPAVIAGICAASHFRAGSRLSSAAAAAIAPIIITFTPPHQGLTPVILLLKNPKIYRQAKVMIAEIFKPSIAVFTKK